MTTQTIGSSTALAVQLRRHLHGLARHDDQCAADGAAALPYWVPCPTSVRAHRVVALALRERADQLLDGARQSAVTTGGGAA